MPRYEYKVVPAPTKGLKGKGVKGAEARFSHAIQELMNGLAGYGWEYQRAETLPSIERAGLTSTTTEWRNVLVFRRPREDDVTAFAPELLPAPETAAPPPPQPPAPPPDQPDETPPPEPDETGPADEKVITSAQYQAMEEDAENEAMNGVESTKDLNEMSTTLEKLAAARKSLKTDS